MSNSLLFTVAVILGLLLNTNCDNKRTPASAPYQRILVNLGLFKILFPHLSDNKRMTTQYSSWELSMFSQILVDISLSRCHRILPKDVQDFRTYVDRVVEQAPPKLEVNKPFMQMWNGLVECFRHTTEYSNWERGGVKYIDSQLNGITDNSSVNNNDSQNTLNSPPYPPSTIFSPYQTSQQPKKAKTGTLRSVGNLFTELYDNTMSIFSSVFRSKKPGSNREMWKNWGDTTVQKENGFESEESIKGKQFYSKSQSSYTKKADDIPIGQTAGLVVESQDSFEFGHLKRVKPKKRKSDYLRQRRFVQNGEKHFHAILESMAQVVKRSCPVQLGPHGAMIKSALRDVFYYLKKDLERRVIMGGDERNKFPLNSYLQAKLRQCGNQVGAVA